MDGERVGLGSSRLFNAVINASYWIILILLSSMHYNRTMFSRSYQQFVSKIAMFLVIFASLAPSISHAIAAQSNDKSFLQEVCSSNGTKKIVVQTVTTQGQQLLNVLSSKSQNENTPASAAHHFEHCPFCSAGAANIAIAPSSSAWVLMLAEQAKTQQPEYVAPVQTTPLQTAHLTRAPPTL